MCFVVNIFRFQKIILPYLRNAALVIIKLREDSVTPAQAVGRGQGNDSDLELGKDKQ